MSDKVFSLNFSHVKWLVFLSYLIGLIADSMLNFSFALHFAPPITLLILFFWSSQILNQTHLFTAFILGLLYDASFNTTLGAHALLFTTLTFMMLRVRLRFKSYPIWQQSLLISIYILIFQVLGWFIFHPVLSGIHVYYYWLEPVSILFFWPLIANIMHSLTQKVVFE